jgi:hypothetical protein
VKKLLDKNKEEGKILARQVIIITHNDADGFYCSLQIFNKYLNQDKTNFLVIISTPNQLIDTLQKLPNYLQRGTNNLVYIMDLTIDLRHETEITRIFTSCHQSFYSNNTGSLEITLLDHHYINKRKIMQLGTRWDINLEVVSKKDLECADLVFNYLHKRELGVKKYNLKNWLAENLFGDEPDPKNILFYWKFVYKWRVFHTSLAKSPKVATQFFYKVIENQKDKLTDQHYRKATEPKIKYSRLEQHETTEGLVFLAIQLTKTTSWENLTNFFDIYQEERLQSKADFFMIGWSTGNYSLYTGKNRDIDFNILRDQLEILGHPLNVIHIPSFSYILELDHIKDDSGKEYINKYLRYIAFDELIELLKNQLFLTKSSEYLREISEPPRYYFFKGIINLIITMKELSKFLELFNLNISHQKQLLMFYDLYELYDILREMVPNEISVDLLKRLDTLCVNKYFIVENRINELRQKLTDAIEIPDDNYADDKAELGDLSDKIFWKVWLKYPSSTFFKRQIYINYKDLKCMSPRLLAYLYYIDRSGDLNFNFKDSKTDTVIIYPGPNPDRIYKKMERGYKFLKSHGINDLKYNILQNREETLRMVRDRFNVLMEKSLDRSGKASKSGHREIFHVPCHISDLDECFDGGFEAGMDYEVVYSNKRISKHFFHYLLMAFQFFRKNLNGNLKQRKNSSILVFYTDRILYAKKLAKIINANKKNIDDILPKIIVCKIETLEELYIAIKQMKPIMEKFNPIAILINGLSILAWKNYPKYGSRIEKNEYRMKRNDLCNKIIRNLRNLGNEYSFPSLFFNWTKKVDSTYHTISPKVGFKNRILISHDESEIYENSNLVEFIINGEKIITEKKFRFK